MKKNTGKVNIHGREYETVASRVKKFRNDHPDYSIETEIVDRDEEIVVIKAMIKDETGKTIATGHAEEVRSSSAINRTSAVENCETSAVGRALASLGYIGTEYASADELVNAVQQQEQLEGFSPSFRLKTRQPSGEEASPPRQAVPGQINSIRKSLSTNPDLMRSILEHYDVTESTLNSLNFQQAKDIMIEFESRTREEQEVKE